MKEYNIMEKVGISYTSYSDAVKQALHQFDKNIYWFEVIEQRGRITEDKKIEFQVVVKIGYN